MSWEILPIRGGLGVHRDQWDALNHSIFQGHPMYESRFVGTLLAHMASGDERLCIYRHSNRIEGMLIAKPCKPGQWGLFLPAQAQISPLLMGNFTPLGSLLRALPGINWAIDLFAQDLLYSPLASEPMSLPLITQDHATTTNISLDGTFEDYWQSRSRNLVKNMRRYRNRLSHEELPSRLDIIRDAKEMKQAVARYGAIERSGWKGREGTAVSIDNPQGAFYADLLEQYAATDQASVYEYYLGNRLAASRLLIQSQHMLVVLKTTYDESLAEFAPGRLLLYELLENEFAEKRAKVVEFYTNASKEQLSWSTGCRPIRHVTLFHGKIALKAYKTYRSAHSLLGSLRNWREDKETVQVERD